MVCKQETRGLITREFIKLVARVQKLPTVDDFLSYFPGGAAINVHRASCAIQDTTLEILREKV